MSDITIERTSSVESAQDTAAGELTPGITLADEERTVCEVWTRVMGYHRPVVSFNRGKQGEYAERVCFAEPSGRAGV
jgi:hypothetical protein